MQQYQPFSPPAQRPTKSPRGRAVAAIVFSLGGLIAVVVIAAVVGAATSHNTKTRTAAKANPKIGISKTATPAVHHHTPITAAGIGTVVKDGDFAFKVESWSCNPADAKAVDPDGFGEHVPANAQECIAAIKVSDDKGDAQSFFDSDQFAYDSNGRKFSADTQGGIYLHGDQDGQQLNPGISVVAKVPFQIPRTGKVVRLALHDSAFSGGVTVRV